MKKLFHYTLVLITTLFLMYATCFESSSHGTKTSIDDFKLQCEYEHLPGEILVFMTKKLI